MARTSMDRLGSLQKAVMEAVWELGRRPCNRCAIA